MLALNRIFSRDTPGVRTSATVLAEINALEHPLRHRNLCSDIGAHRAQLESLTGQARQEAAAEVADLEATAAGYRTRHAKSFDREDELMHELAETFASEHRQILSDRSVAHDAEAARLAKLATELAAAQFELMAQRIATHMLSKKFGMETRWTFGYSSGDLDARAKVILAELQA